MNRILTKKTKAEALVFLSTVLVRRPLRGAMTPRSLGIKNKQAYFFIHSLRLVPGTGLEPAHLAAYAPKAYVSTNSTIRAWIQLNYIIF